MDAAQLTNESRFNGLFIGDSGDGKKSAACTFPKPLKYFDFDGRIRGLLGSPWVDRKGIDYKYYPPIRKQGEQLFYKELNDDLDALYVMAQTGQMVYKTIVMGSLTGETFALLRDSVKLSHFESDGKAKNRWVGSMPMPDPGDYGYVSNGTKAVLGFLRSLPGVHVIVTAHTVDKYEKPKKANGEIDPYADSVKVGTKLSLSDKLAAEIPGTFDNVFHFSSVFDGNQNKYYCRFRGDMARTTFPNLPNFTDVTKVNFYEYLLSKGVGTQAVAEVTAQINK